MRKSFWLFAIVLSMSLGIRAQAAPREIPDRFNTGVDTDTELTEIPEPGFTVDPVQDRSRRTAGTGSGLQQQTGGEWR